MGDDFAPTLPVYREDPAIAETQRRSGRWRHTDPGRTARVDALARDLARSDQQQAEGRVSGGAWELAATVGLNVAADAGVRAPARAAAVEAVDAAEREERESSERVAVTDGEVATAEQSLPASSPYGTTFTQWWAPLVVLPVLIFLELKLGTGALAAALPTSGAMAVELTAGAIAVVLTAGAEVAALMVGGRLAGAARWVSRDVAILAVAVTVGLAVWSVVALAHSRTANLAYSERFKAAPTAAPGSFGFGGTGGPAAATGAEDTVPGAPTADGRAPDLGFVIPLTLLGLAVGMVLAVRCGAMRPRHVGERELAATRDRHAKALAARSEASRRREAAVGALDEQDLAWAAFVQREADFGNWLLDRLQAEYDRACAVAGRPAGMLPRPAVPAVADLVTRSFDPVRAPARRPEAPLASPATPAAPAAPPAAPPAGDADLWAPPADGPEPEPADDDHPPGWSWFGPPLRVDRPAGHTGERSSGTSA